MGLGGMMAEYKILGEGGGRAVGGGGGCEGDVVEDGV